MDLYTTFTIIYSLCMIHGLLDALSVAFRDPMMCREVRRKEYEYLRIEDTLHVQLINHLYLGGVYYIFKYFGFDLSTAIYRGYALGVIDLYLFPLFYLFVSMLFYTSHLCFHVFLYKYHKIHHEYQNPISIYTFHCHILEQLFVNIGPVLMSLYLIPFSDLAVTGLIFLSVINAFRAHTEADTFHHIHHLKFNVNYGLRNGFFDRMYGTLDGSNVLN